VYTNILVTVVKDVTPVSIYRILSDEFGSYLYLVSENYIIEYRV